MTGAQNSPTVSDDPEDYEPIAVADGRSKLEVIESLDDDGAVGHAYMDLFEEDWHTSHVSLEKLQTAIEAATSEHGTHIRFYINESGVVIFQKGYGEGVVLMPMTTDTEAEIE